MSMLKKIQNLLFEEDDDDIIDDEDELEDTVETKLASKPAAAAKPVPAFDTTPAVQETKPTGMQRIDVTQSVPIEQTRPQKKKNESVFKQPEPAAEETKPASSIGSIKLDEEKTAEPKPAVRKPQAKTSKPAKPVRKEERTRPSYQFQPVISPIFGVDEKDMNALKTTTSKITEKERSKMDKNVSPIISPMYGANPDESPLTIQKTVEETSVIEQMTVTPEKTAAEDDIPEFSLDDILKIRDDEFTDERREINEESAPLFPDLTFGEEDDYPDEKIVQRSVKDNAE